MPPLDTGNPTLYGIACIRHLDGKPSGDRWYIVVDLPKTGERQIVRDRFQGAGGQIERPEYGWDNPIDAALALGWFIRHDFIPF